MAYSHIPTFVAAGTFTSGTAALTVTIPTGYRNNDLFVMLCESANQAITAPTGWTEIGTQASQATGTAAAAGGVRLAVFYKIAGGLESSVTVADSGDHTTAQIFAFRGIDPADPFDSHASSFGAASTSMTWPTITTTVANTLILMCTAVDTDLASTATVGTVTAASLTSITERADQTVIAGAGGGIHLATGIKATAGAVGTMTATASTSVTHGYLTLALKGRSDALVLPRGQYQSDWVTPVPTGGVVVTANDGIVLQADVSPVFETDNSYTVKLEAKTVGTSFTGATTATDNTFKPESSDTTYSARGGSLEYDSVNDYYIYWGGYDGTTRYNNIWIKDMTEPGEPWRKQTTTGTAPTAANLAASAFYASNGVGNFVIWGGNIGASDSNQMMILNTTTWAWRTVTQTSAPTARSYITRHMVAVPNGSNADIYLFGGWASSRENQLVKMASMSNTSTTGTWTTLKATGAAGNPTIRSGAIMSYKASTGKLYLFGGYSGTSYLNDFWEYDISGNTWTQKTLTGTAPTATELGTGGYDVTNNRFWYSGGWTNGAQAGGINNVGYVSNVGSGEAWNEVRTADSDNQQYAGHSSAASMVDTKRGWLVMHGMMTVDSTERYNFVIDFNDGITSNKPVYGLNEGEWMSARDAPATVWNPHSSEWLLINGFSYMGDEKTIAQGTHHNDIWAYDQTNNRWRYANKGYLGMPHTEGSVAVYDSTRDRIVVFSGLSGVAMTGNEVWSATRDDNGMYQWAKLTPTGTPPTSRWLSAAVYDATNDRMIVTQGGKVGGPTNETWELSFTSSDDGVWTQRTPTGSVTGVTGPGFAAKTSNTRLYVFAGATNQALTTVSSQLFYLDYSTTNCAYTVVTATGATAVRTPAFGYDDTNNRLITMGGFNGSASINNTYYFNLTTGTTWAASTQTIMPDARRTAGAMFINGKFYISHGRSDSSMWYKNTWELTPNYTTPASSVWANKFPRMFIPEYFYFDPNTTGDYHWQAWVTEEAVDHTKVSYGSNLETAIDFTLGGTPFYTRSHGTSSYKAYNVAPDAVTLNSPANAGSSSLYATLRFTGTDPNTLDLLTYEIQVDLANTFDSQ